MLCWAVQHCKLCCVFTVVLQCFAILAELLVATCYTPKCGSHLLLNIVTVISCWWCALYMFRHINWERPSDAPNRIHCVTVVVNGHCTVHITSEWPHNHKRSILKVLHLIDCAILNLWCQMFVHANTPLAPLSHPRIFAQLSHFNTFICKIEIIFEYGDVRWLLSREEQQNLIRKFMILVHCLATIAGCCHENKSSHFFAQKYKCH